MKPIHLLVLVGSVAVAVWLSYQPLRSQFNWIAIDLVTIALGAISFFAVMGEALRIVPVNRLTYLRPRILFQWERVIQFIRALRDALNTEFVRSSLSPPTFDDDVALYKSLRPLATSLVESALGSAPETDFADVKRAIAEFRAAAKGDRWVEGFLGDIDTALGWYDQARGEVDKVEKAVERNDLEQFTSVVGPYTASATIALSVLKALGGS